jgi:hypothetical protein
MKLWQDYQCEEGKDFRGTLPAQEQHDRSLKSYPSQPDRLDSHYGTQSGLGTDPNLEVLSHLLVLALFLVLQWFEAEHKNNSGLTALSAATEKEQILHEESVIIPHKFTLRHNSTVYCHLKMRKTLELF